MNIPSFPRVFSAEICPKFYSRSQEMFSHVVLNIRSNLRLLNNQKCHRKSCLVRVISRVFPPFVADTGSGPYNGKRAEEAQRTCVRHPPAPRPPESDRLSTEVIQPRFTPPPPPTTCRHSKCS